MMSDTNTAAATNPVTTVWIVQRDSYTFNDDYVVSAHVPGCFYLTEREAMINAGYMNMQVLFEQWDWFMPPTASPISEEFFNDEYEGDDDYGEPGSLLAQVYQMSLDDACLFFADPNNISDLMEEAGHELANTTVLYMACRLPLSGAEPEEDEDDIDDESDTD